MSISLRKHKRRAAEGLTRHLIDKRPRRLCTHAPSWRPRRVAFSMNWSIVRAPYVIPVLP